MLPKLDFFYNIKGSKEETVIFCGDRWTDFYRNGLGYNQWVPLTVDGEKVKFNSVSKFHLNSQFGEWIVGEKNNWILNPSFYADSESQETMDGWKNFIQVILIRIKVQELETSVCNN